MTDTVAEIMRLARHWAEWLNVIGSRTIVPGEMQAELELREKIVSNALRKLVGELDARLVWLFTHCRAIGMEKKSDSGLMEHDITLFTIELKARAERAEAEAAALRSVLIMVRPYVYGIDNIKAIDAALAAKGSK